MSDLGISLVIISTQEKEALIRSREQPSCVGSRRIFGRRLPMTILEGMDGGAVGDGNAGGDLVAHAVRYEDGVLRLGDDLLAAAIAADEGNHSLPDLEIGDIRAEPFDHSCHLGTG